MAEDYQDRLGDRWGWRVALVTVPAIVGFGSLSGWLANSGYGNAWFDALSKPTFMPPGWLFGVVWPILYALLGLALAAVLQTPATRRSSGQAGRKTGSAPAAGAWSQASEGLPPAPAQATRKGSARPHRTTNRGA